MRDVRVVALCDSDADRLKRVGDRFDVDRRYRDSAEILDDPDVDAVAVCVPAESHVPVAIAALDAGKHVFVEKPLALGLEDADRLISRASRSDRRTMVGFNLRWHRSVLDARATLRAGTLGPVELVRSTLTSRARFDTGTPAWRRSRSSGGGEFLETAIHHFDLWRFLLATEVQEVTALSRSDLWDDESVAITARLANGALATAAFSARTADAHEIAFSGSSGRLSVSLLGFGHVSLDLPTSPETGVRGGAVRLARATSGLPRRVARARRGGDWVLSYRDEWGHFSEAIRGNTAPDSTLEDGRQALRIALAAIESSTRGAPVRVPA
jgi:myo-inositol 2-dehydrogenase/D-chiro-inositol 1-dehydrogenase